MMSKPNNIILKGNGFNEFSSFIVRNESITLFSAFINTNVLKEIDMNCTIKQVIVRWRIEDLCVGASDLNLYQYCKDNNIILYRNTRIHLKALWDNNDSIIFGSANVTAKGLGLSERYNYELNGRCDNMSFNDVKVETIERSFNGIDLYMLEEIFRKGEIKFYYTMSRVHNPLGTKLSTVEKEMIIKLAYKYNVFIVEDDYMGIANSHHPGHHAFLGTQLPYPFALFLRLCASLQQVQSSFVYPDHC